MQPIVKRRFKDNLFEQFARIGRALSNPHRLELLDVLAQGERSVEQLAQETALSIANCSQHLQVLRRAGLATARRDGAFILYRLAGPTVLALWQAIRAAGEVHVAEVDRVVATFLSERATMEEVGADELRRRLLSSEVLLIDVRPTLEYRQGHIAGAVSIPVDELPARLGEIPSDRPVVAYCRGPYCVYADEAISLLTAHGRRAARLTTGYPDWQAAGLPSETGG